MLQPTNKQRRHIDHLDVMVDEVKKMEAELKQLREDRNSLSRLVDCATSTKPNGELGLTEEEIQFRGRVAETVCQALFGKSVKEIQLIIDSQ